LHARHVPWQALAQQTMSVQLPDSHVTPLAHMAPDGRSIHVAPLLGG